MRLLPMTESVRTMVMERLVQWWHDNFCAGMEVKFGPYSSLKWDYKIHKLEGEMVVIRERKKHMKSFSTYRKVELTHFYIHVISSDVSLVDWDRFPVSAEQWLLSGDNGPPDHLNNIDWLCLQWSRCRALWNLHDDDDPLNLKLKNANREITVQGKPSKYLSELLRDKLMEYDLTIEQLVINTFADFKSR